MALSRGEFGRATDVLHQSEAVAREAKDTFTLAANLNIQATVTQLLGDDRRTTNLLRESVGLAAALCNTWALPYRIVQLGGVTARRGHPERVARLFGVAESFGDAAYVATTFPDMRALYEQDLANVRSRLDEDAFDVAGPRVGR